MKSYIEKNPKILGGKPVIAGTRVPISRILFLLRDGYTVETIMEEYPYLNKKSLLGAIDQAIRELDISYGGAQIPQA